MSPEVTQKVRVMVGYWLLALTESDLFLTKMLFAAYAWLNMLTMMNFVNFHAPTSSTRIVWING